MSVYPDYERHVFRSLKLLSVVNDAIEFFIRTPTSALPPQTSFGGCGVYALYYRGNHELYSALAEANRLECTQAIYVGKAVPPGWRAARASPRQYPGVYRRLREHANSIGRPRNIKVDDFCCRFVILEDAESDLIGTIEAGLIRRLHPVWNSVVDGFGNHDPGKGR